MRAVAPLVVLAALTGLTGCGGPGKALAVPPANPPHSASPPSGGLTRIELARGVLPGGGPVRITPGLETVVMKLVLEPGASSGWHRHSDGGVFVVTKGALASYGLDGAPCAPVVPIAGQAFVVPPAPRFAHLVRNESAQPAELLVYYVNVPPGQAAGHPAVAPAECAADLK